MESDAMDLEEIKDSPLTITLPPEVAGPEVVGEEGCCAGLNLRRFFSELTSRALRAVRGDLADDGRINLSNIGDYADIVRPTADAS
jgi:hypothetical protein